MKKVLKQFFTFTCFFIVGVGILPPVIARADTGDAINDILEGDRYVGAISTIKGIVQNLDKVTIWITALIAYSVITFAMLKILFAAAYVAFPKFCDAVHEAHQKQNLDALVGVAGKFKGGKGVPSSSDLSTLKQFFLGMVPDIKAFTDFEDETIDPKGFFLKAIPEAMVLVMIGIFCYNGYSRDLAVKVGQFGSEVFNRVMDAADPVGLVERVTNSGGMPDFQYENYANTQEETYYKVSKAIYSAVQTRHTDMKTTEGKQYVAASIENQVVSALGSTISPYCQDADDNSWSVSVSGKLQMVPSTTSDLIKVTENKTEKSESATISYYYDYGSLSLDGISLIEKGGSYIRVTITYTRKLTDASSTGGTYTAASGVTRSSEAKVFSVNCTAAQNNGGSLIEALRISPSDSGYFTTTGSGSSGYLNSNYKQGGSSSKNYSYLEAPAGTQIGVEIEVPNVYFVGSDGVQYPVRIIVNPT